jgi:hypothetical protein
LSCGITFVERTKWQNRIVSTDDGAAGKTVLITLPAIVVIAGVAIGAFAFGRSETTQVVGHHGRCSDYADGGYSSDTASNDLPISVASNSTGNHDFVV